MVDVDGNRYVDYVCSWGPLIHGHAHPAVLAAVAEAAARGTSFGAPTAAEVRLAEEVTARMESVEMLRMTSSGTEASMTAVRLARAATGREKVLKFAGAYHGHLDGLLAEAGSGLATAALPASLGVPASVTADTVIVPWNDPHELVAATEGHSLAAILAEPMPANMGVVPARAGFLELLREQADATGALLVLDEVISGFRVAAGGAQELTGVQADLTIMGKVLGGGLPAAAVGGREELMELLAPAGGVYQAGTLSGNPLAVAAGLATLELLDESAYLRLAATTEHLAEGLGAAAADAGRAVQVAHQPGLLDGVLRRAPRREPGRRAGLRPGGPRRVVPGAVGARRVPAAVAVRGLVPLTGPHHRARRAHSRGRRGRLPGGGVMTGDAPLQDDPASRGSRGAGARTAGASSQDGPASRDPSTGEIGPHPPGGFPYPYPSSLQRLDALLREQGGLLASLLPDAAPESNGGGPAQLAAAGPRDRRGVRGVRAAGGGGLRGLSAALRRSSPALPR